MAERHYPNWWGGSLLPYDDRAASGLDGGTSGRVDEPPGGGGGDPRGKGSGGGGGSSGGGGVGKPAPESGAPAASPVGGPAGIGGTGGYGFVNLAQYLYANPNQTGIYAPTPGEAKPTNLNVSGNMADKGGLQYGATGAYTQGMSGVDNALNAVYGRNYKMEHPASFYQSLNAPKPAPTPGPEGGPGGSPRPRGVGPDPMRSLRSYFYGV